MNLDMLATAKEKFAQDPAVAGKPILQLTEITMRTCWRKEPTSTDDSWEDMVPEQVAELIKRRGFFGYIKPDARD